MNLTTTTSNPLLTYIVEEYYIPCSLSSFFALISILISSFILILIYRTKPRLHTVNHLLISNTCIASIFYCFITIHNYIYLIFLSTNTNDIHCRYRAYFAYIGIAGVIYSYLIQSISRLFFAIFATKYRILTTFKAHYILIFVQWLIVFLITLPSIVTTDITYHPLTLCWVSMEHLLHTGYTVFAYYLIPVVIIIIIYITIYQRVRRTKKNTTSILLATVNSQKRDLGVLRNILILLSIYLGGSIATILFILTSMKIIYLIGLVSITATITIEKLLTIFLDREIRLVVTNQICRRQTLVQPFQNNTTMQMTTIQQQQHRFNS